MILRKETNGAGLDEPADDSAAPAIAHSGLAPLAVDAQTAAGMFGVSVRHWWALHSSGRCPLPIRIGRSSRWRVDELRLWLAAGCPTRERWQEMRDAINPRNMRDA